MSKRDRSTPLRDQTSIVDGVLYFEDVRQAEVDTEIFTEIIDDKYTTSIRVVSLATNWQEKTWITDIGYVKFDLSVQMTLRKEMRSGTGHWYAYRRVGGRLYKKYVGQSDRVTSRRIADVARSLPGV